MSKNGKINFIKHIKDNHIDNPKKTLCGKYIKSFEYVFESIDHWFDNYKHNGRILGCSNCLNKIKEALI